jgi:D-cysteine desulfhydrase
VLPESFSFARIPTPITILSRLSALFDGVEIFIKRDDLTGAPLSGNKVRKLDFVLADAASRQADTLITCGGTQSNHARATAVLAAQLGMQAILVLRGSPLAAPQANLLLDKLVGAHIRYITADEYRRVLPLMEQIASEEAKYRGRKPYIIPEGASNAMGSCGYIKAVQEIKDQQQAMGVEFDAIVVPVGSGGTLAGLLMGKKLYGLKADIIGVCVCDSADYFTHKILDIAAEAKEQFGDDFTIDREDIHILEDYVGAGYAKSIPQEIEVMLQLARTEGIILDPVYSGKAMTGLLNELHSGRIQDYKKILFIHTGGIFGWFTDFEKTYGIPLLLDRDSAKEV